MADLDPTRIPRHVGLILDGNGRWANARGLPRTAGHAAGEAALFDTVEGSLELGIEWLTAYTFSTENWSRDADEVEFLMWFNQDLLTRRRDSLADQGVRMHFIGDLADRRIPDHNRKEMEEATELTAGNERLHLVFAFNYGSQREIAAAAATIAKRAASGELSPTEIDEKLFSSFLYLPEMPPLDLVIRSSGEHRLSNFLLWQAAYAEFWFPGILWPDFNRDHLRQAVIEYQGRERRFGGADGP
ncbi:MAG: di-trans,poly-cis-decaprenylcistransferase [Acidimicrobiia bacterium]|nr:di-trans,poly-cis-decaprenylcistransferase [Acidimicrobiia bacterium]MDQ3500506.1 polyprenyl diphosphate synthase [Actinomycetota bacterium]